jgi:hypothetical protein
MYRMNECGLVGKEGVLMYEEALDPLVFRKDSRLSELKVGPEAISAKDRKIGRQLIVCTPEFSSQIESQGLELGTQTSN